MPDPRGDLPRQRPLILRDVYARRGGVEVLRGVDLEFPSGSRTVVIGPSGSGKSTLLRLLNRLADPTGGWITLGDAPIAAFSVTKLRRVIGLVFQTPRPLPGRVIDNLVYAREHGRNASPKSDDELQDFDAAAALLEVGLNPSWLDRDASGLSGGERQRLALAVALQTGPEILALDEPTSALDLSSARRVADALRLRSERDGLTTIAVTHNRDHAGSLGDRTVVLEAGRVIDLGPTTEVLARDHTTFRAEEDGR